MNSIYVQISLFLNIDWLVLICFCFHMQAKCSDDMPMPTLFHFLALLAFRIFAAEQVRGDFLPYHRLENKHYYHLNLFTEPIESGCRLM